MPLSKAHKQQSKQRILNSAVNLFSRYGFNKVSIDEIMLNAEMTRGAFYAHFDSKEHLYSEAILFAAANSGLVKAENSLLNDQAFFHAVINNYLHKNHIEQKTAPCSLAFLTTDVANEEKAVRDVYTKVFRGFVKIMHKRAENMGKKQIADQHMMAIVAMMIGGVAVGRAITDSKLVDELLESCRDLAMELIGNV